MLPTFVIGLREGLEAALIVGIIAAFLNKQGRGDLLRWVLGGVGVAVLLCVGAGVALDVYSQNLPQKQQEGLETVIGALAVGMVTYMVVWMRRHSRTLRRQLEGLAAEALATGGKGVGAGAAIVLMAFLAVIREGLETVVFLLAAFNEPDTSSAAGFGVVLGVAVAVALGYGIYRGGVRLDLSKFFRATGLVLVLVAAGLVVSALHTAHEAGWLNAGQGSTIDLSWLVQPGSVQASLLSGMLGIQPRPVVVEVVGWLLYVVPVGLYVAWPPGKAAPSRLLVRGGGAVAALGGIAAISLTLAAPGRPQARPVTRSGQVTAQVVALGAESARIRTQSQQPAVDRAGDAGGEAGDKTAVEPGRTHTYSLARVEPQRHAGADTVLYRADDVPTTATDSVAFGAPTLTLARITELNGGRLPIGLSTSSTGATQLPAIYHDARTLSVWLDPRSGRVVDLSWVELATVSVRSGSAVYALSSPVASGTARLPAVAVRASASAALTAAASLHSRSQLRAAARWTAAAAALALLTASAALVAARRRVRPASPSPEPVPVLIAH